MKPAASSPSKPILTSGDRYFVGLSGGLASAVTAALIQEQGHEVIGFHLTNSHADAKRFRCGSRDRRVQAKAVCQNLGIPYVEYDCGPLFDAQVLDSLVHDSLQLKVPQPCEICHREVLLATLVDQAARNGCNRIATGHQAQLIRDATTGRLRLLEGTQAESDQSFWLASLSAENLERWFLPLGTIPEELVRRLAAQSKLPAFLVDPSNEQNLMTGALDCAGNTPEIQNWLDGRIPQSLRPKGFVRDPQDRVLTDHRGLHHFRLGQAWTGQGPDSAPKRGEEPLRVVELDTVRQLVILGKSQKLQVQRFLVRDVRWFHPMDSLREMPLAFRTAPRGPLTEAWALPFPGGNLQLELKKPQVEALPGLKIVFQRGTEVLGVGRIDRVFPIV